MTKGIRLKWIPMSKSEIENTPLHDWQSLYVRHYPKKGILKLNKNFAISIAMIGIDKIFIIN